MSEVKQEYLKNKNEEIISPICSASSVLMGDSGTTVYEDLSSVLRKFKPRPEGKQNDLNDWYESGFYYTNSDTKNTPVEQGYYKVIVNGNSEGNHSDIVQIAISVSRKDFYIRSFYYSTGNPNGVWTDWDRYYPFKGGEWTPELSCVGEPNPSVTYTHRNR